ARVRESGNGLGNLGLFKNPASLNPTHPRAYDQRWHHATAVKKYGRTNRTILFLVRDEILAGTRNRSGPAVPRLPRRTHGATQEIPGGHARPRHWGQCHRHGLASRIARDSGRASSMERAKEGGLHSTPAHHEGTRSKA